MALTKTYSTLLAPTATPMTGFANTKAGPTLTSQAADLRNALSATMTAIMTNGASAPGAPCSLTIQVSGDGTTWRDLFTVAGDVQANSTYTWAISLGRDPMYARGIAYGNTTNPVTVGFEIMVTTGP